MSDHNEIVATIEKYIDGGRKGKSSIMKEAFAENATMFFSASGKLGGGPIQNLFDAIDGRGPSPDLVAEIGGIDVNHTTATARIELFNWGGARYTDQLTLLKLDGNWKIMNKVYHNHS